jgi:hypothetical protein
MLSSLTSFDTFLEQHRSSEATDQYNKPKEKTLTT